MKLLSNCHKYNSLQIISYKHKGNISQNQIQIGLIVKTNIFMDINIFGGMIKTVVLKQYLHLKISNQCTIVTPIISYEIMLQSDDSLDIASKNN